MTDQVSKNKVKRDGGRQASGLYSGAHAHTAAATAAAAAAATAAPPQKCRPAESPRAVSSLLRQRGLAAIPVDLHADEGLCFHQA